MKYKFMRPTIIAFLSCVIAGPAMGQKHYRDLEFPALRNFEVPEAMRVELSNGMVLFLIEDHELPLVTMSAQITTGAVFEDADKVGLATITGDVMREGGTTSMSSEVLNERLEDIAASISTSIGATSGSASMSTLKENVDDVLLMFADVLMNPAFPEDRIELSKSQVRTLIGRRNDESQDIAFREFLELLHGSESPWARSEEYQTVDSISREDVVGFHAKYFHPNNVIMGVWGDFDTVAMVKMIDKAFEAWERDETFVKPELPPYADGSEEGVYLAPKEDVTQSVVVLGHRGEVARNHEDYPAITIMNEVLSGVSGRLYQHVRDDQGLAYAVFGSYTANYDRPGNFYAGVMTKSESTTEAAESVLNELKMLRDEAPTDDEVELAKESFLNSFVFNFDTRSEVVGRMMTFERFGYPADFLQTEKEAIEKITPKDVQRVAQEYVKTGDARIMVVGKPADFTAPLSDLGEVSEIDITIPVVEPEVPEATESDLDAGAALFEKSIGALGGRSAFQSIKTLVRTASQDVTTADNMSMSIGLEIVEEYGVRAKFVQSAPVGEISILVEGDAVRLRSPQGEMDAPESVSKDIHAQRWRDIAFLFAHADEVSAQSLGPVDFAGAVAEALRITTPRSDSFTLYLSTEDHRPVGVAYQGSDRTGAPVASTDVYQEYGVFDGLTLPVLVTTEQGGASVSTRYESFEVNAEVSDSDFE